MVPDNSKPVLSSNTSVARGTNQSSILNLNRTVWFILAGGLVLLGGATILIIYACCCTSGKVPDKINESELNSTTFMSVGSSTIHSTTQGEGSPSTTYFNTNMGLSIPVYMKILFGVDIRPIREIARGAFGAVHIAEPLKPELKTAYPQLD